jgi:hypothetical protein
VASNNLGLDNMIHWGLVNHHGMETSGHSKKNPFTGWLAVFVLGALILSCRTEQVSYAFASAVEDDDYSRSTLRGLHGVYLAVGSLSPEVESLGLTTAMLKRDAELKLRMAGIKVLSKREWVQTKGGPVCYVEVNIVNDVVLEKTLGFDIYAYDIRVEFNQDVVLVRDITTKTLSPTWSSSYLGITNSLPRIRGKVKDMIDSFIAAFLDVNPREAH